MNIQTKKSLASLLIGLSISILYWVGSFIIAQSQMVLRSLALHPLHFILYGPIGIVLGIIIYFIIRKSNSSFLLVGIILFSFSIISWVLVGLPFVQHLILPPTTFK